LLGLAPDGDAAPDTLPLDRRALTEENFDEPLARWSVNTTSQSPAALSGVEYHRRVLARPSSPELRAAESCI